MLEAEEESRLGQTELLRWKIAHLEPLAVSLAGWQKEEELVPELEKVARIRGGVDREGCGTWY